MDERIKKAEEKLRHAQHDIIEAEEALHGEGMDDAEEMPVRSGTPQGRSPDVPQERRSEIPEKAPVAKPAEKPVPSPSKPDTAGKWRVEYERENCIGAGACVAANADFWSIDEDGKAILKSAVYDEGKQRWVLYLDDEHQLQKQRDAAGVCPVNVIHIIGPDGHQEI